MLEYRIDSDLSETSFEWAWDKLFEETREKPVGIIVSSIDHEKVKKVISADQEWKSTQITIIEELPRDMWILYNTKEAIYSDGA